MVVDDADAFFVAFESDFELMHTDKREEFIIEYWKKR